MYAASSAETEAGLIRSFLRDLIANAVGEEIAGIWCDLRRRQRTNGNRRATHRRILKRVTGGKGTALPKPAARVVPENRLSSQWGWW